MSSFQKEDELCSYFHEARDLMSRASFNLRSWASNSDILRQLAKSENVLDPQHVTKVLGMMWNTVNDELAFANSRINVSKDVTKRELLRQTSKIYDPLGLLTPVTLRAKLLIQDIWKRQIDWDTPLSHDIQVKWTNLARDLKDVMETKVRRFYFRSPEPNNKPTLYVFVDASQKSYGAAAYIVSNSESTLVMSKNRVAPLKAITLPRLENSGCRRRVTISQLSTSDTGL